METDIMGGVKIIFEGTEERDAVGSTGGLMDQVFMSVTSLENNPCEDEEE